MGCLPVTRYTPVPPLVRRPAAVSSPDSDWALVRVSGSDWPLVRVSGSDWPLVMVSGSDWPLVRVTAFIRSTHPTGEAVGMSASRIGHIGKMSG